MNVCGIIAEYNPLHNGHLFHISQTKNQTNCDFLIVVMSGSFTQRGECAITNKWERAKWAILAGADMVLELPALYATSSAQNFAMGAVNILNGLNVCDTISFGSEVDNLDELEKIADLIHYEDKKYILNLKESLSKGNTYAYAKQAALLKCLPNINPTILQSSNCILGIQYLIALKKCNSKISPMVVKRTANQHNDLTLHQTITSATSIRNSIFSNKTSITNTVPDYVNKTLKSNKLCIISDFDNAIKTALYTLGINGINKLQGVEEGLENRIYKELCTGQPLKDVLENIKTKRYIYTRLQRIMINALLNIQKELVQTIEKNNCPTYARILAMKKDIPALTSAIKSNTQIPIISKASNYKKLLNTLEQQLFEKDVLSTNIYSIVEKTPGNQDFVNPIIVL